MNHIATVSGSSEKCGRFVNPLRGWIALVALMSLALAGCDDAYRINHFHSDANQKAAEQSLGSFEEFTSQTAGLEPSLLKNIEARKQVEDAVGASRSRVRDTEAAGLTTDATWERLRLETYVRLGLLQRDDDTPPRPLKLDDPPDLVFARSKAAEKGYDKLLSERIATREMKVTAIAKVLQLSAAAHKVLAEETQKKFKQTQAELARMQKKDQPPDPDPDAATDPASSDRVQWVRDLFQKIIDARTAYLNNQEVMKTANEVQRKLLAEIESSRDPVEAAALVAVVGTGLSDFDFAILDAYVIRLDDELETLEKRIADIDETASHADHADSSAKSDVRTAWDDLKQSLSEARVWVAVAVWLSHAEKDPDNWFLAPGVRKVWVGRAEIEEHNAAIRKSLRPKDTSKASAVQLAEKRLEELLKKCDPKFQQQGEPNLPKQEGEEKQKEYIKTLTATFSNPRIALIDKETIALKLTNSNPMKELLIRAQSVGKSRDGSALQESINAIQRARQSVKGVASKVRATAGAVTSLSKDTATESTVSGKVRSAKGLASASASRAKAAISLRQRLIDDYATRKPGQSPSKNAEAEKEIPGLESELKSISNSGLLDLNAEQGFQLLDKFLGLDAQISGLIDDAVSHHAISEDELKWLGGIVSDIEKGETDKHERILIFLNDLYGAAVDLGQENARHAQGMLTVANIELRRWALIGHLNDDYQMIFITPSDGNWPLFADPPVVDKWNGAIAADPNLKLDLRKHPAIKGLNFTTKTDGSDNILISIRKLRETAKAWQDAPQINDPTGENLRLANDRLFKAVRTLDGHLLMLFLNQHISEENVVRLHAELASHDIRLDTLKTRVVEAGYRLTLSDLKAFHSSGVTDQDIQTIADLFANGFLAWIGSGTNHGGK